MKQTLSQNELIYRHLKSGKSITPMEALSPKFGDCWALSSRMSDLKKKYGNIFDSETVTKNGKSFSKYYLKK